MEQACGTRAGKSAMDPKFFFLVFFMAEEEMNLGSSSFILVLPAAIMFIIFISYVLAAEDKSMKLACHEEKGRNRPCIWEPIINNRSAWADFLLFFFRIYVYYLPAPLGLSMKRKKKKC